MKLRNIALAFQFLTIIPVKTRGEVSEKNIADSSIFFPVVGIFQGLILVAVSFFFLKIFSSEITAVFALFAYFLTNGGFHQDGLSDTFDALSVKSTGNLEQDRGKRLAIMKDSTIGPIGATAIIFSLLFKLVFINTMLKTDQYTILFLMPLFSKWAMVSIMYHSKSAREDGIGMIFLKHCRFKHIVLSAFITTFSGLTAFYLSGIVLPVAQWGQRTFMMFLLCEAVVIYFFCIFLKRIFTNKFGGLTGDNFGAIHEISEIAFLMVASLWT